MAAADELVTILGVEVSKETMQNLSSFKAGIDNVVGKLNTLALVAGGFMAAAGFFIKGVMDDAKALEVMSEKSGLSTDSLQEWQYAADKAGVSAQAVQGDLANLNKTMSSPIPGEFNMNFAMLGVSVRDANGALKSSDDLLGDVAAKMSGMSRQEAIQWGSKIGVSDDTVLLLRQGKEGLEALRKEAHDVGAIIPSEALKRSEEFRKSLVAMQGAMRGVASIVAIATMPALQRIVESFTSWIQENRKWIALNTEAFMQGFVNALERVYKALQRVGEFFKPVIDKLGEFALSTDRTEQFTHLLTGALLALGIIFAPFLAKLALVSAAFAAISYVVEDVFTYMEGGDSVIGRLQSAFEAAFPQWADLLKTIAGIVKDLFLGALEVGWAVLKRVGAAALEVFGAFGTAINEVAGPLSEFITTFEERFPAIVGAVKGLAEVITGTLGFALDTIVKALKFLLEIATTVFKFLLEKIADGMGKLNDFLSWLGIGGDKKPESKKEPTPSSAEPTSKSPQNATPYSPLQDKTPQNATPYSTWSDKTARPSPFEPTSRSPQDATRYAPLPDKATRTSALAPNAMQLQGKQTALPSQKGGGTQINDNKTVNQQIYTSDPQQAANMALQGMGAAPQINTAGLYAPVVR